MGNSSGEFAEPPTRWYAPVDELTGEIRAYNPKTDEKLIRQAYSFAEEKHKGQFRQSKEPFFSHPVAVAQILIEHKFSDFCVATALLHDTIEDCDDVEYEDIRENFGETIAELVNAVTKLTKQSRSERLIEFMKAVTSDKTGDDEITRNIQNILSFMVIAADDSRSMVVKLADRLHNMRTISHVNQEQRETKAIETMEIYAPLAERFGMNYWRQELEDEAFKALMRDERDSLRRRYAQGRGKKTHRSEPYEAAVRIKSQLEEMMHDNNFDVTIMDRVKRPYSIWRKLREQKDQSAEQTQLFDIYGFQVIVEAKPGYAPSQPETAAGRVNDISADVRAANKLKDLQEETLVEEVYRALYTIHSRWKAVPNRFKDYVSNPKPNGYRSLHTTVAVEDDGVVEIQIKTREMHLVAEYGAAAHWAYRDNVRVSSKYVAESKKWIDEIKGFARETSDAKQFMELFKLHISPDRIFCFTPNGRLINLPSGSTALDFAYQVHTEIGNTAQGVFVDRVAKHLSTVLRHGQTVLIETDPNQHPVREWTEFVKTPKAKQAISRAIREQEKDTNLSIGFRALEEAFGEDHEPTDPLLAKAAAQLGYQNKDEMVRDLGANLARLGKPDGVYAADKQAKRSIAAMDIVKAALPEEYHSEDMTVDAGNSVMEIVLQDGRMPAIAPCCRPLPNEIVVGLVDGKGVVSLHAIDCAQLQQPSALTMNWVDASWPKGQRAPSCSAGFIANLDNKAGVLGKICKLIGDQNTNISDLIFMVRCKKYFQMFIEVQVRDSQHLANIMTAVEGDKNTSNVYRCRNVEAVKNQYRGKCSSGPGAAH